MGDLKPKKTAIEGQEVRRRELGEDLAQPNEKKKACLAKIAELKQTWDLANTDIRRGGELKDIEDIARDFRPNQLTPAQQLRKEEIVTELDYQKNKLKHDVLRSHNHHNSSSSVAS